jgi:hypothetical protein
MYGYRITKDKEIIPKGKFVISYGRSGLYDLYIEDELICEGINYKDLETLMKTK